MATAKQIEANRRNAQKSTGPKSVEGKDRARWNAVRHGLTAASILPHEDEAAFEQLRAELADSWQPANAQELALVDQIAHGQWRMQRAQRFEAAMFQLKLEAAAAHLTGDDAIVESLLDPAQEAGYRNFFCYDTRAQATFYRAIDRLRQLQADRRRLAQTTKTKAASATSPIPELASFGSGVPDAHFPPFQRYAPPPPPPFPPPSTRHFHPKPVF